MPITGRFAADFSSFLAAVDKAELALVDMGKGASGVETKLNRMVDNFSGRKLVQEASLMTIALEKAGGVSVLTAKEFEQVGTKANDAADKLRRLGYEVPPGLQRLAEATQNASGATSGLVASLGSVGQLIGAFGIGLGVSGIIGVGKAILDDADSLVKLHDKTGIAIEGLQILRIAGDDAGNTLDEITNAVSKMQQRIAGGDASAVSALARLGINFAAFRTLAPDQQFIQIGDAIAKVKDPADQVRLAVDLFGRTGAEVLPTLKRGFDDLKDSAGLMSSETVKALDASGDALTAFYRREKGILGGIAGDVVLRVKADIDSLRILFGALPNVPRPTALALPSALSVPGLPSDLAGVTKELADRQHQIEKAYNDAAAAAKKFRESVEALTFKKYVADAFPLVGLIQDISARSGAFREHLDDLTSSENEFHNGLTIAGDEIATVTIPLFSKLPDVVARNTKAFDEARSAIEKVSFSGGLKDLLTGKGFGQIGSALQDAINPSKILNTAIGGALSGGISSLINLGVQGIGSLFKKIFGNPEKEINPIREAFVQTAGGLATLNEKAFAATGSLALVQQLLNAKNAEQYKTAIDALNNAFAFQDQAMQTLDDTVAKYGFTLEELGPKFRQGKLDDSFLQLFKDQQVLTAGGIDFDLIIQKQAASFQGLIATAQQTGASIPEQLKPIIQRMIDLGLLTDLSGEKLTDIGKLTFAETLDNKFNTLIDTIQKLVSAISGIPRAVTVDVGYNYQPYSPPSGNNEPIYAASGFEGRVSKPTLFMAGEGGGAEDVSIRPAGQSGGGGLTRAVLNELRAQTQALQELPRTIRDAVLLAT